MLQAIHPVLPMRNKQITMDFYVNKLGFAAYHTEPDAYPSYLMVWKDHIEIHFCLTENPDGRYCRGACYIRTNHIEDWYKMALENNFDIPPNEHLRKQTWGQSEFSLNDPDGNMLIFGQNLI